MNPIHQWWFRNERCSWAEAHATLAGGLLTSLAHYDADAQEEEAIPSRYAGWFSAPYAD